MLFATDFAAVIRPLQLIVLGVAGLFLLRVMRASTVAVRPEKTEATSQRSRRRSALALEFIEPDQHAGERIDVERVMSIGRGVECDIVVDDTYLSTRHAQISYDDGDLMIEDLGSTNGTYVNQALIASRTRLERGDIVQTGGVLFEVIR